MININLVPEELQKKKKHQFVRRIFASVPAEVFVGTIGGCLALLLAMNVLLQFIIFGQLANGQRLQMSLDRIAPEKRQVDQVLGDLKNLRQKIGVIEKMTSGKRVLWAQKLNSISDLILPGVWLDGIVLDKDFLIIQGKVVSKKGDQLISINRFNENLRSNSIFMKGIKGVQVSFAERKKEKTIELGVFTITATLREESYE